MRKGISNCLPPLRPSASKFRFRAAANNLSNPLTFPVDDYADIAFADRSPNLLGKLDPLATICPIPVYNSPP